MIIVTTIYVYIGMSYLNKNLINIPQEMVGMARQDTTILVSDVSLYISSYSICLWNK